MFILKVCLAIAISSGLQSNSYRVREITHKVVVDNLDNYFLAIKILQYINSDPEVQSRIETILNQHNTINKESCASIYDIFQFIRTLKYKQIMSPITNPLDSWIAKIQREYNWETQHLYYDAMNKYMIPKRFILLYNASLTIGKNAKIPNSNGFGNVEKGEITIQ